MGGGAGTWDNLATANWWDGGALVQWNNALGDLAIFGGTSGVVTLGGPISAGGLRFNSNGYTLTGSTLTLAGAASLYAELGESVTISSLLDGTAGLTKIGGGAVRLAAGNTYTGVTTISNGSLIITDQSALGASTDAIIVTESNPVIGSTATLGFWGGSLVLDGTAAGFTISRDLTLQGGGPINSRSGALQSFGNNTLSGAVSMSADPVTQRSTRIISSTGLLTRLFCSTAVVTVSRL